MASIVKRLSGRFSLGRNKDPELTQLKKLSKMNYKDQAIWFLNAFWNKKLEDGSVLESPKFLDSDDDRETVFKYFQECVALDSKRGTEGFELDEMQAHRLLEKLEHSLTVVEMREEMRKVDIDFNRMVSLFEFLLYKFKVDWKLLVNSKKEQGEEMQKILQETQELWASAQAALKECEEKAQAAADAEQHAIEEEARAVQAEEDALAKEATFEQAENEARDAENKQREEEAKVAQVVKELEEEERQHEEAIQVLTKTSKRLSLGIVKRGKAKNELAQLEATETTGLRTARLNQEAALRRQQKATKLAASLRVEAEKARKPFKEAREQATAARTAATEAKADAVAAREAADQSVQESIAAFKEAEESLNKVKEEFADAGQGRIWWMERELTEAKKFMSKKQLKALEG